MCLCAKLAWVVKAEVGQANHAQVSLRKLLQTDLDALPVRLGVEAHELEPCPLNPAAGSPGGHLPQGKDTQPQRVCIRWLALGRLRDAVAVAVVKRNHLVYPLDHGGVHMGGPGILGGIGAGRGEERRGRPAKQTKLEM